MRTCEYCGVELRFIRLAEATRTHSATWSQPMTLIGRELIEVDEIFTVTEQFMVHSCVEGDLARHEKQVQKQKAWNLVNDMPTRKMGMKELIEKAQKKGCPTCKAKPRQPCMNLTARKRGAEIPTVWPHATRLDKIDLDDDADSNTDSD